MLGAALGLMHAQSLLAQRLPEACERTPLWVEGRVTGLPETFTLPDGVQWQRFAFALNHELAAPCHGPRRLLLSAAGGDTVQPGEHWRFEVSLRRPWGMENPGADNQQRWYAEAGIDAVGSVRKVATAQRISGRAGREQHHRQRQRLSQQMLAALGPEAPGAILRALAVADRSGLDQSLWSLFRHYGISHLLVISGLHIGMVAACGLLLGSYLSRLLGLWGIYRFTALLAPLTAVLLATGYTALAGFTLATSRAWLMIVALLCAMLAGRPALSWHNLLLAAAVLVALQPLAVLGAGFWLSFGSVASLLWFAAWRKGNWLGTHLFMAFAMLPMSGAWFGGTSLVSAFSNALLVPLVGFIVVPLVLAGTLAALVHSPMAAPLWSMAAWPLERLLSVGTTLAEQHSHRLYTEISSTPLALVLCCVALALCCVPLGLRHKALLCSLILPLLLPLAAHRVAAADAVHILVLDVGQGTSVLIYDRDHALLYDTGGGSPGGVSVAERAILPVLRQRGISHLDTVLVSHGDRDHSAGLGSLQTHLSIGSLLVGLDQAQLPGASLCEAGAAWRWRSDVRFQLLAPAPGESLNKNDGSCVLRAQLPGLTVLLAGDIGAARERALIRYWGPQLASQVALAPHHGSQTSSSWAWLARVKPEIVVYTHGRANRFGHPASAVMQRHADMGVATLSSAESGALEWVLRPHTPPQLVAHRELKRRYWKR